MTIGKTRLMVSQLSLVRVAAFLVAFGLGGLMRSFLTVLGIVIGVSAVITMVTVGNGATLAVQNQISGLGTNLLQVRPGQRMGHGVE